MQIIANGLISGLTIADAIAANIRLMLYGVLLVVMMHFRPQGLAGNYRIE